MQPPSERDSGTNEVIPVPNVVRAERIAGEDEEDTELLKRCWKRPRTTSCLPLGVNLVFGKQRSIEESSQRAFPDFPALHTISSSNIPI